MKKLYLNNLAKDIHTDNVLKGFYDKPREIGTSLMLVVSELSEALEADRKRPYNNSNTLLPDRIPSTKSEKFKEWFEKNIKDTVNDEIADAVIRLLDFCAWQGIDIHRHIKLKLAYNRMRSHRHGKNY